MLDHQPAHDRNRGSFECEREPLDPDPRFPCLGPEPAATVWTVCFYWRARASNTRTHTPTPTLTSAVVVVAAAADAGRRARTRTWMERRMGEREVVARSKN